MSPGSGRGPRGVLFDLDGVLAQTERLKAEAHARTVAHFGGAAPADFYRSVIGHSFARVRDAFLERGGIGADPPAYERFFAQEYDRLLEKDLEATPGVDALVDRLSAEGYRLGVVSSSRRWMVDRILARLGLSERFEASISADDVRREKPDPEPYLRALDALGLASACALAVEDTPAGAHAAQRAGLKVLMLRHEFNQGQDWGSSAGTLDSFQDTGAVLEVIRSLLPPGSSRPSDPNP